MLLNQEISLFSIIGIHFVIPGSAALQSDVCRVDFYFVYLGCIETNLEQKPNQMFCLVSWPDTSLALKCCIAWQQAQNVFVHQFAMIAAIESAGPSCSLLLRLFSSEMWRRLQSVFFFFFLLILIFSTRQPPGEKKPRLGGRAVLGL